MPSMTITLDESCVMIDEKITICEEKQEQQVELTQLGQLIFFDLETGGLSSESDILQIAALDHDGNEFNVYCRPTRSISKTASRINQITYKDGVMYYRKQPVECEDIRDALTRFASFLDSCPAKQVILVAHNAPFDKRFLTHHVNMHKLQHLFYPKLTGYADTVRYFKAYKPGLPKYKLELLTHKYLPKNAADTLHNALTDVINLQLLFNKLVLNVMLGQKQAKDSKALIQDLVYQKIDSQGKNVEMPKKRKQIVCTSIEKHTTKFNQHITCSVERDLVSIQTEMDIGRRLTRSKKTSPLSQIHSESETNQTNGRPRRCSAKRNNENPHHKTKKSKTTH